ncbi:MAG: SUMF1/EgtB/PvdO family nonheme iron enzyme [Vicinamibacteria bacterium]
MITGLLTRRTGDFSRPVALDQGPGGRLKKVAHERLKSRLREARFETDRLFALLRGEALYERPGSQPHRLIFFLGHLESFDWNLLCRDGLGLASFDHRLDRLFGAELVAPEALCGSTPQSTGDAIQWPTVAATRAYNRRVRTALDAALDACAFGARVAHPTAADIGAVELAIEYRLMMAERIASLIHQLPQAQKKSGPLPSPSGEAPPSRFVEIAEGSARLGLDPSTARFAWDVEYGRMDVRVPVFAIQSRNVTNDDYLSFVNEGGYTDASLWSKSGWAWRQASEINHPAFWVKRARSWKYRSMFGEVPLNGAMPVYVSHAEAEAYARWKGSRLPSEAEFHRAAFGSSEGPERAFPWGEGDPWPSYGVFGFDRWDPAPVCSHPAGDTPNGLSDMMANGWEWTSTQLAPFVGYQELPALKGHSAKIFEAERYVLKGASPRTSTALMRRSFRQAAHPHCQFSYSTFRCVQSR